MPERRYFDPEWETLDREQLSARQFALVKAKLEELNRTNRFYSTLWDQMHVDLSKVWTPDDFARVIPIVSKEDFLRDQTDYPPFGRRLGVGRDQLAEVHLTSGTSGIGQAICGLTQTDVESAGRSYAAMWTYAGLERGDVAILTYPVSFLTAGLIGVAAARLFQLVPIFAGGLEKSLIFELMGRLEASTIFATPSFLRRLQVAAQSEGWDPKRECRRLKAICTGLLMPPFSQIEAIMEFWGVPVHENYGTTEAGMAAAVSCEFGLWDGESRYPMHFLEQYIYPEVVDPETGLPVAEGEEGELVMTTFRRQASPAVRYRTRDRVVHVPHTSCPCGRPFDGIMPGEIRRYDDMLKIKGMSVWPAAVDNVLFSDDAVDEYRAVVLIAEDGREELVLRVALKSDATPAESERAMLLARLQAEVKRTTFVTPRIVEVDRLDHFDFKPRRWTDLRATGPRSLAEHLAPDRSVPRPE